MSAVKRYLSSSIGKKQIIAASGFLLIVYVVLHLIGNLLIFAGPDAFNGYTEKLHSLGLVLRLIEFGLASVFVIHIGFTAKVVMENRWARSERYNVSDASETRSFAAKMMAYSGSLILLFLFFHLADFTFADPYSQASEIRDINFGLYGLVYNSFLNPVRSIFYILVMVAVGLHVSHSAQSLVQTFGLMPAKYKPLIRRCGIGLGIVVAVLFSSIPIYIMIHRNFWSFFN